MRLNAYIVKVLLMSIGMLMSPRLLLYAAEAESVPLVGAELDLFADVPMIISASRQETSLWYSSAAVNVVDSETLSLGGWQSIAELMKFQPAMSHLSVDRRRYALGVHGLHDWSSNRTLYLIDGMPARNHLFGFTNFHNQPLISDNVDQIEIVRSPGGAAWGANAFNGVVNVITKEPGYELGWQASSQFNHVGDTSVGLQYEGGNDTYAYRIQLHYMDTVSSADALDEEFAEDDWSKTFRINADFIYHFDERRNVRAGLHTINQESGTYELLFHRSDETSTQDRNHAFIRYRDNYADGEHLQIQSYIQFVDFHERSVGQYDAIESGVDFEWQQQFAAHQLTLGSNASYYTVDNDPDVPEDLVLDDDVFSSLGVFAINSTEVDDSLTTELQLRVDTFEGADDDWSARASIIKALDQNDRCILRAAIARAYRIPSLGWRESTVTRFYRVPTVPAPLDGQVFLKFNSNEDLKNEEVLAFELGIRVKIDDDWEFITDAFVHRYEDLSSLSVSSVDLAPSVPQYTFRSENGEGADLLGVSVEFKYQTPQIKAQFWYAYHDWDADNNSESMRAFEPPEHALGGNLRYLMSENDHVQIAMALSDETPVDPIVTALTPADSTIDGHLHLDVNYRRYFDDSGSAMQIGILNAFEDEGDPVPAVGSTTEHEQPGQLFYLRVNWNY